METQAVTENIFTQDGLRLYTKLWRLEDPAALLCIHHGFGEHLGRYEGTASHLLQHGVAVLAMDMRGHGKSEGRAGHAPSIEALLSDIEEMLKLGRREYNDVPIFLFGHSMGGNLVLNFALQRPVTELTAIIVSSPWLRLAEKPPSWKLKAARFMAGLLPKFRQKADLDTSALSKLPEVVTAYEQDELVHGNISVGLFTIISDSGEFILEQIANLKLPCLAYNGTADRIADFPTNQKAFGTTNGIDWKEWPGTYHEPHNDTEQNELLDFLKDWLLKKAVGHSVT